MSKNESHGSRNLAAASLEDYRELARRQLPCMMFDTIEGGSFGELTVAPKFCRFKELADRMKKEGSRTTRGVENTTSEWLRYHRLDDAMSKPIGRVVLTKSVACLGFDYRLVESLQNVVIDTNPCEDR